MQSTLYTAADLRELQRMTEAERTARAEVDARACTLEFSSRGRAVGSIAGPLFGDPQANLFDLEGI